MSDAYSDLYSSNNKYSVSNYSNAYEDLYGDHTHAVRGHWIDYKIIKNNPVVKCSVCDMQFCDIINNHQYMYRFCPYCGAQMDEEE